MTESYHYQVRNVSGKKIMGGVVHAKNMDAAYNEAMKRAKIIIRKEYYDDSHFLAGHVWRERLIKDNKPVSLLIGK